MNNKFTISIFLIITLLFFGCAPIDQEGLDFDWDDFDWEDADLEDFNWSYVDWSEVEWEYVDFSAINWSFVDYDAIDWTYLEWTSIDWSEVEEDDFNWSAVDWEQVNWSNFDWRIFELDVVNLSAINWSFIDYEGYADYLGIDLDDYEFQEWEFNVYYTYYGNGTVIPEGEKPFNITEILFKQAIPDEGWEFEGWYLYVTDFEVEVVDVHEELEYITSEEGIDDIISGEYDYAYLVGNQEDLFDKIVELTQIQQELVQDTNVDVRGDFDTVFLFAHFTEKEEEGDDPEGCVVDEDCGGDVDNGDYVCSDNECVIECDEGFSFDDENDECVEVAGIMEIIKHFVNITKTGEGTVEFIKDEALFEEGVYLIENGTSLLLNATPSSGWEFRAWYVYDLENETEEDIIPVEINESASFFITILFNKTLDAEFIEQGTNPSRRSSRGGSTTQEENETEPGPLIFVYPEWMLQGRGTALDKELEPEIEKEPESEPEQDSDIDTTPDPEPELEEIKKSFFEENFLIIIITASVFVLGGAGAFLYEYKIRKN